MVYGSHHLSHFEIILVVLEARNELAGRYIKDLEITIRGIVPTILVGHVVAGHTFPDDSWSNNAMVSSIWFRSHSSIWNDSQMSAEQGWDTSFPHIQPVMSLQALNILPLPNLHIKAQP
ncbi:hypothetical protein ARMGADRAFT_1036389 [Armillaria gallica]|uniref:Uncharacterized protein n=1 Tax=Armillaria gallica TaxID=47427 RepID=A0A2H3CQL6_ARMGA|nr:hypothetical protein ARMGADRAFT_1036389 [Armillaria gallica]